MITTEQTFTGTISYYSTSRYFGFIETEENTYFFFFDKMEQRRMKKEGKIKKIHKFSSGDEVEFKLRVSFKNKNQKEAFDLRFIRNFRRQQLLDESKENEVLDGYLKQLSDGKFFVKHLSTYVYIPIKMSEWEEKLDTIYFNRINKLIQFKLTQTDKIDKLSAVLIDRKFCSDFEMISHLYNSKQSINAIITGRNSKGVFATIFNGKLNGFVSLSKETLLIENEKIERLRKKDNILVTLKNIPNNRVLSLKLAE